MKNYYTEFKEQRDKHFNDVQDRYFKAIDLARDNKKENAHNIFQREVVAKRFNELQSKLENRSRFFVELQEIYDLDKTKKSEEIFNDISHPPAAPQRPPCETIRRKLFRPGPRN